MNPDSLREWLKSVGADLRAKRVLPVVALLILIAVAIPLLLSHSGKAADVPVLPPVPTVTAPDPATLTSATSVTKEPSQNYLTGPAHNPFAAATTTSAATATAAAGATSTRGASGSSPAASSTSGAAAPSTPAGGAGAAGTGSGAVPTVTVSAPTRTRTVAKTTTVPAKPLPYSNYEVEATLHQTGVDAPPTVFHNLSRDQQLPSDATPFATFLGVRRDEQTAVFVLQSDVTVTGQGNCAPSATTCTFLTLIPGQSATLVVAPSGAAPDTFTLRYVRLKKVSSSASVVTVDPAGAADVKSAQAYLPQLKTIAYAQYTGLLSIDLGSTVPVTP